MTLVKSLTSFITTKFSYFLPIKLNETHYYTNYYTVEIDISKFSNTENDKTAWELQRRMREKSKAKSNKVKKDVFPTKNEQNYWDSFRKGSFCTSRDLKRVLRK